VKAIVGLGNPGPRYAGTRHNVGFDVVDELARRTSVRFDSSPANAVVARIRSGSGPIIARDDDVVLVKPLTFMNLSGQAVGELVRYFKMDAADVLIVFDEVQLPLGKLRARPNGSAGGHNGLKSVIEHLGNEVARLRLGVGRGDAERDLANHVLATFEKSEAADVARMIARAADASEVFNGGDSATGE